MALHLGRFLRFATSTATSRSLKLSLLSPHESFFSDTPVKQVTVPGAEGYFTVTSGHSAVLSTLRPGVVSLVNEQNATIKYFLSGGFLVLRKTDEADLAQVTGVEIVPLEHLDKERTAALLQEVLSESQGSTDPWLKTRALLAQDLCSAILKAV